MRDFREIKAWHKAHKLTLLTYQLTKTFPNNEQFGIRSQMRRAAYSIPSNIAEGCGRDSQAKFARFMFIAMGSASELEYFTILAHDLTYLQSKGYQNLNSGAIEVKKMLAPFIRKLKS